MREEGFIKKFKKFENKIIEFCKKYKVIKLQNYCQS